MATSAKKTAATAAPAKAVAPVKRVAATTRQTVSTKPAVKSVAKSVTKPAPTKKISAPEVHLKASTAPKPVLSAEQRNHYVAVAAFYIAERRGFTLGSPQDDWLAAEAEIDRLIASGHFSF